MHSLREEPMVPSFAYSGVIENRDLVQLVWAVVRLDHGYRPRMRVHLQPLRDCTTREVPHNFRHFAVGYARVWEEAVVAAHLTFGGQYRVRAREPQAGIRHRLLARRGDNVCSEFSTPLAP